MAALGRGSLVLILVEVLVLGGCSSRAPTSRDRSSTQAAPSASSTAVGKHLTEASTPPIEPKIEASGAQSSRKLLTGNESFALPGTYVFRITRDDASSKETRTVYQPERGPKEVRQTVRFDYDSGGKPHGVKWFEEWRSDGLYLTATETIAGSGSARCDFREASLMVRLPLALDSTWVTHSRGCTQHSDTHTNTTTEFKVSGKRLVRVQGKETLVWIIDRTFSGELAGASIAGKRIDWFAPEFGFEIRNETWSATDHVTTTLVGLKED